MAPQTGFGFLGTVVVDVVVVVVDVVAVDVGTADLGVDTVVVHTVEDTAGVEDTAVAGGTTLPAPRCQTARYWCTVGLSATWNSRV